jgi:glucan 1,3-beta-glucosidase
MTDITFNGGLYGLSIGNQQFTMRNLVFNNVVTAISQIWSWGWVYQGLSINNCGTGIDMSAGGSGDAAVGSLTLIDSTITDTPVGIITAYDSSVVPATANSLMIENTVLDNVPVAIQYSGSTVLAGTTGTTTIAAWGEGHEYLPAGPSQFEGAFTGNSRPASLLDGSKYYVQSKPQYQTYASSSFKSVRSAGAAGNGVTDDTSALQAVINSAAASGDIVYFDAGTYLVTSTLSIPAGSIIVGESYATIMSSGSFFNNMNSPAPVVQVGTSGETGTVQWSDMIVATQGTQAGAILIEWNLASPAGTPSGMWDVHTRIGGFTGSNLQVAQCPASGTGVDTSCIGAFMSMYITSSASGLYLENNWFWNADHDIDNSANSQVTVYSGRGLLIESTAGTLWL